MLPSDYLLPLTKGFLKLIHRVIPHQNDFNSDNVQVYIFLIYVIKQCYVWIYYLYNQ